MNMIIRVYLKKKYREINITKDNFFRVKFYLENQLNKIRKEMKSLRDKNIIEYDRKKINLIDKTYKDIEHIKKTRRTLYQALNILEYKKRELNP